MEEKIWKNRERYTFFSKSSKNIHLFYIRSSDCTLYIIYTRRTHLVRTHIWQKRYTVGDNEGKKIYGNNFFKSMLMKQILGYTMVI